ncbi:MAG TPA: hypothetical protein VF472_13180 [Burkholderiaceae bacterium]
MSQNTTASLPQVELQLMIDFLQQAVHTLRDQSCNDFIIPWSADKEALLMEVAKGAATEDDGINTDSESLRQRVVLSSGELFMYDVDVAAWLGRRFAGPELATISLAEADVASHLFEQLADMHQGWSATEGEEEAADGIHFLELRATPAHQAFMLAALAAAGGKLELAHAARIAAGKSPISIPEFIALRYLAQLCRDVVAAGQPVALERRPADGGGQGIEGVPHVPRLGVPLRFPEPTSFGKQIIINIPNWENEELVNLQRFSVEGPGFVEGVLAVKGLPKREIKFTHASALKAMRCCVLNIRQHAMHVALGVPQEKPFASAGLAACVKRVAELQVRAPHVYSAGEQGESKDLRIAGYLLVEEAFRPEEIEIGLQDFHAASSRASVEEQRTYAHKVAQLAANSERNQGFLRKKAEASASYQRYRKELGSNWQIAWQRSLAWHYWTCALASRMAGQRVVDLKTSVPTLAHYIMLGWHAQARRLLPLVSEQLASHVPNTQAGDYSQRRPQFFAAHLASLWGGVPVPAAPDAASWPVYQMLLAHWQHPNPQAITQLLLAACDLHTRIAMSGSFDRDIDTAFWFDPFEILLLLWLRREHGLANPVLDHPLMNTPLGELPEPAPLFVEPVLECLAARLRADSPSLAEW